MTDFGGPIPQAWLLGLAQPGVLPAVTGLAGLLVGSFLNTVIHRLPRMLERDWRAQCAELAGDVAPSKQAASSNEAAPSSAARYDLMAPRSHCPACRTPIRALHLIPVIGWLLLRGRCAACGTNISPRYPLVELASSLAFVAVALRFGPTAECAAALVVTGFLIALAVIDFDTHYLPDQLTLPLLWLGLAASLAGDVHSAVIGAIVGYLVLWSVYQAFKLATGKEGMGYGDFKLLAALGAWLGPAALLPIVLASSVAGAVIGLVLIFFFGRAREQPLAFGPYLAAAGWLVMMAGDALPGGLLLDTPLDPWSLDP
ncbi:MAG: prepilin peptidase [Gammaproteobacteria bacterium]|jgi:leader peptidase (prepilin peptidase)/N-methyltransferase|nr:prepilin peptidase [Gammaproteobacteria bacterium]